MTTQTRDLCFGGSLRVSCGGSCAPNTHDRHVGHTIPAWAWRYSQSYPSAALGTSSGIGKRANLNESSVEGAAPQSHMFNGRGRRTPPRTPPHTEPRDFLGGQITPTLSRSTLPSHPQNRPVRTAPSQIIAHVGPVAAICSSELLLSSSLHVLLSSTTQAPAPARHPWHDAAAATR